MIHLAIYVLGLLRAHVQFAGEVAGILIYFLLVSFLMKPNHFLDHLMSLLYLSSLGSGGFSPLLVWYLLH